MNLPPPPNLVWPPCSPDHLPPASPQQFSEHHLFRVNHAHCYLNHLDNVLPPVSWYLVDMVLLANDGEREEGAGIRGVILWDEELEQDTQRLSRW